MKRLQLTAILTVIAAALAVAAVASSQPPSASNQVSASLTYGGRPGHTTQHLQIINGGQQLLNQRVRSRFCSSACVPADLGTSSSPLRVVDLESNGQPDVILGLYTNGAHCCYVDQVYSFDPGTMTYVRSERDFLDARPAIDHIRGRWAFVSADARFAYRFSDYAHSGLPLQIMSFSGRGFHDITRQFPVRLRDDAARWLRLFHHNLGNGEGLIAAWAADEYLLGHGRLVRSTLAAEVRRGDLRTHAGSTVPTGKQFVSALAKLLRHLGYTAGA